MRWHKRITILSAFLLLSLLLASCGSGDSAPQTVQSLEDVKKATIRVVAHGSFEDPQVGTVINAAGSGTGFIIDESGLAVTNNHVVTGAALLEVYVEGRDEPLNAKILGVSECSDLAVIDIEGEGYPSLGWYEGDISTGTDVYAAGYPLGDPEFTLTRGIVSKEKTSGETPWSSVDHVIEHDATINPGNSGGPLVTEDGEVVGVNYLKSAQGQFVAAQYFAIARDQAVPIIEQLQAGVDVNSVGVNGEAVNDGQDLSGIWVASVKSGSPADVAGVQPADIILSMESLVLATDYTLSDYCDILRTHEPGDVLNIEVLRYKTGEVLKGQLNGRPLEQLFSYLEEEEPTASAGQEHSSTPASTIEGYPSYHMVNDYYKALEVELPTSWSDINAGDWSWNGTRIGISVWASPDNEGITSGWTTPGLLFYATGNTKTYDCRTVSDKYEQSLQNGCLASDTKELDQRGYHFVSTLYSECGGVDTIVLTQCATPIQNPDDHLIWLEIIIVNDRDIEAVERIRSSFRILKAIPFTRD